MFLVFLIDNVYLIYYLSVDILEFLATVHFQGKAYNHPPIVDFPLNASVT